MIAVPNLFSVVKTIFFMLVVKGNANSQLLIYKYANKQVSIQEINFFT